MKFMPVNIPGNQGSTRPHGCPPGTRTGGCGSHGGRGGGSGSHGGCGGRCGGGCSGGPSASSLSSSKISSNVDNIMQDAAQGPENNKKRKYTDNKDDPVQGTDTEVDRPMSKQKAKKKAVDSDDEDDQDTPKVIRLTAYICVTSDLQMKKRSGIPSVQKGPFNFLSTTSYEALIQYIADTLPCPCWNIPTNFITWVLMKPAKVTELPLGGETGYRALLDEFHSRTARQGYMLTFIMPLPSKDANPRVVSSLFRLSD